MTDNHTPLTTELRLQSQEGDRATIKDVPVTVMQALYHEITGRVETVDRLFEDSYVFSHTDVTQLIHKFLQFIQQFDTKGADVQFKVSFHDHSHQNFSSLVKFQQFDRSTAPKAEKLNIVFSFLLATPGVKQYQNYRVIIDLRSYVLQKSKKNLRIGIWSRNDGIAKIQVEYIDYILARNLLSIFDDWLRSLDISHSRSESKVFTPYNDDDIYEGKWHFTFTALCTFTAFLLCLAASFFVESISDLNRLLRYILLFSAVIFGAYVTSNFIYRRVVDKYWTHGHFHF